MCTVGVIPSTSAVRRTSPARYYPSPSYVVLVGVLSSPAPPLIGWTTNVLIILSYSRATSPSACVIASSGVWASSSCSKNLIHGCQVEFVDFIVQIHRAVGATGEYASQTFIMYSWLDVSSMQRHYVEEKPPTH